MTSLEKIELSLIPVLGAFVWLMRTELPDSIGVGTLLFWVCGLLLFQGLLRDLWLLAKARRATSGGLQKRMRCMCAESTIGMAGVVLGAVILGCGIDRVISVGSTTWIALSVLTTTAGFLIKDYVVQFSPLRVRHDKDHVNIVVSWR